MRGQSREEVLTAGYERVCGTGSTGGGGG